MKKFLYSLVWLLVACAPVLLDEDTTGSTTSSMRVHTRSEVDIDYPLTLYAFDSESGELATSATQNSAEESAVTLDLPKGQYLVVAITGTDGCNIPETPSVTDIIRLPESKVLSTPLQMGSAAVYVTGNTTVNITLYNQVAAIELVLSDIPAEATSVNTSFSLLYDGLSFGGAYSGNATATVPLVKEGDTWRAPLFYTLPGSGSKLTLSITTTTPSGTQTYGYTHNETLEANTPYSLVGSYSKGFSVNGSITLAGWNEPKVINFRFGDETPIPDSPGVNDSYDFTLSEIPEAGTLWNGHIIAAVPEITDEDVELLLLSTTEWAEVTSAFHGETSDMAANIVDTYVEGNINGWKIPTRDEAKLMRNVIGGSNLEATNDMFTIHGIATLSTGEDVESGNKVRYLCDDANYSFIWDDTSVSKCGSKRTYHLRAVKRIRVKLDVTSNSRSF